MNYNDKQTHCVTVKLPSQTKGTVYRVLYLVESSWCDVLMSP